MSILNKIPIVISSFNRLCSTVTIKVGSEVVEKNVFTRDDVKRFCEIVGDSNPLHFDDKSAQSANFSGIIVPGLQLNGTVSSIIGTKLPGPGSILVKQFLDFVAPCYVGEQLMTRVWVAAIKKTFIDCHYECFVIGSGKIVMKGDALIYKPVEIKD